MVWVVGPLYEALQQSFCRALFCRHALSILRALMRGGRRGPSRGIAYRFEPPSSVRYIRLGTVALMAGRSSVSNCTLTLPSR